MHNCKVKLKKWRLDKELGKHRFFRCKKCGAEWIAIPLPGSTESILYCNGNMICLKTP